MSVSRRLAVVCLHTCPWQRPGVGDGGGLNVYVRQTTAALAAQGWSVDIFTRLHAGSARHRDAIPGVQLYHVPAGPIDARKESLHEWLEPFVAEALEAERQRGGRYHAVLSHYWLSGLAAIELARHWRAAHIASFHTLALAKQAVLPEEEEPSARADGERRIVAEANHLLAVSHHERAALTDLYNAHPATVSIASPGIDLERFHPQSRHDARDRLGLSRRDRVVLAVGRATPIKGFDILLEALAQISDWRVKALFVGGNLGSVDHCNMQAHARRLGIEHLVRFVGSVENEVLPIYYAACDACVVPSRYESFGLVALESIACGRPVVGSRVGGLQSILVGNALGVPVTPGSVTELVEALRRVLSRAEKRNRTGMDGSITPELPSWWSTADAISTALNKVP